MHSSHSSSVVPVTAVLRLLTNLSSRVAAVLFALWMATLAVPLVAEPLWLASDQSLFRVDTLTQRVQSVLPLAGAPSAVVVARSGGAWVVAADSLIHVNSEGELRIRLSLDELGLAAPVLIAADARDEGLWIASTSGQVMRLNESGQTDLQERIESPIRGLAVARDQSLWLLTATGLRRYASRSDLAANQFVSAEVPVDGAGVHLALDQIDRRAWIATAHALHSVELTALTHGIRLDAAKRRSFSTHLAQAAPPLMAIDALAGGVWLAARDRLLLINTQGISTRDISLSARQIERVTSIAVEPLSGALWIAHALGVDRLDTQGLWHRIPVPQAEIKIVARSDLLIEPTISIVSPLSASALVRGEALNLTLKLGAKCNGVPCGLPPLLGGSFTLQVWLDADDISNSLTVTPDTGIANAQRDSTSLQPGLHTLRASLVDGYGQQTTLQSVQFKVLDRVLAAPDTENVATSSTQKAAPNKPPTVSLTAPSNGATLAAGAAITLQATAADTDGSVAKVEFFRGGSTLIGTAVTAAPYSVIWSSVPAGSYALTAKATDNAGAATTSAVVNITAVVINQPPTVSITAPTNGASVTQNVALTISANAADVDGTVSKVEFFQGSTLIATVLAPPYTTSWTPTTLGSVNLTAKATDNASASTTSAATTITVAAVNLPPLVAMTGSSVCDFLTPDMPISLGAAAIDRDGRIVRVEFLSNGTLIGTALRNGFSDNWNMTWSAQPAGTYSITARATDNVGAMSVSAPKSIVVAAANVAPVVSITSPLSGQIFPAFATITVSANATDSDGAISGVSFSANGPQGGQSLGNVLTAPYTLNWPNVSPGSYSVRATATDNRGASVSTSYVAFTVTANTPPSVTLVAPVDNAQGYVGAPINVSANASDSDGTITKVEFFVGATLLATKLTPPYAATWTPSAAGTFAVKAVATDNNGGVATSSIANVVINANAAPTVSLPAPASGNQYFTAATIVLAATAADSDGSVVRVDYYSDGVLIGSATAAPWRLVWDNAPVGVHTVTAVATDNRGARTTSPPITITVLAGPAISVDASPFYPTGVEGATVDRETVLIIGHVDAPANSGVLLNGRRIPFSPSTGRFFANNVPLKMGTNAFNLQVVTEDDQTATRSVVITRTGSKPFTLEYENDEVFGLQTVTAWLRNPTGVAIGDVVFNFNPSGTPMEFTRANMGTVENVGVTLNYALPGAHDLSVQVWNADNTQVIFTAQAMVRIYTAQEIDGLARNVYNRMIDRLTAGNVTSAVKAINITARDNFAQLFTSYGAALPEIAASSSVIKQGTVSKELVEYILLRTVGTTNYAHSLYLMRGPDGVWRIDSM